MKYSRLRDGIGNGIQSMASIHAETIDRLIVLGTTEISAWWMTENDERYRDLFTWSEKRASRIALFASRNRLKRNDIPFYRS